MTRKSIIMSPSLILVYNAKSGLFNTLADGVHKLVSPDTYSCNLCQITWGPTSMKKEWKQYLKSTGYQLIFLHQDELTNYPDLHHHPLPAIFIQKDNHLSQLISAKEINELSGLDQLIKIMNERLVAP